MEGKTHIEKVVGGTEEEKSVAKRVLQETFEKKSKLFSRLELEKTPEDIELINKTESAVNEIVSQYSGEIKPLPPEHIFVLPPGGVSKLTGGKSGGGLHQPIKLSVAVEKGESTLLFASALAHELFHLKSFKSVRVGGSGEDVRMYRSGFSMFDRSEKSGDEKEYFAMLEEAIVAECAKKFREKIAEDQFFISESAPLKTFVHWVTEYYRNLGADEKKLKVFGEEIKYISDVPARVDRINLAAKSEYEKEALAAKMYTELEGKGEVEPVERYIEREKLYNFLDRLVHESSGKFASRDEVFDVLASANFSGNYMPAARMIESILGKGSFRKVAEDFSKTPKK